ncbi:hypothetical protein KI387_019285 [Taxus chinensis]|uniref:F-box domain-containing protein n=1 Tax=Taxus chinensis TaxID=29808 RepID=A0AA38G693_TAXCH|nr:hypothetical protein KI387_019285 [Taxus chinensis]
MHNNPDLTKIPQHVIGSMISLRVLDLSRTIILSFPKSIRCLKHLDYLRANEQAKCDIVGKGMSLSRDIVAEILKRVDGITLAKSGCCCSDLRSIADEETLWEHLCRSLWPSTGNSMIRRLISSLGGFKKFYADCFPLIDVSKQPMISSQEDDQKNFSPSSLEDYDDEVNDDTVSRSDFVSLVDIHYNDKAIYS